MEPEQKLNGNGALMGSIIIIIILIIGGIYFWKVSMKEKIEQPSDDTANMEAELDSVDLESLDQEI